MTIDTARLRELATAATPEYRDRWYGPARDLYDQATDDPATVLALLDRIDRLETQVRILLSNIDMIFEAESIADEDWALIHEDMAVARAALGDAS